MKERAMTTTTTIHNRLDELGTLSTNQDNAIQRDGADLITEYFNASSPVNMETTALVLHYLTDIQVRDFALGLIDPAKAEQQVPLLEYLVESAPTDSEFINAPACLLAALLFELEQTANAVLMLINAQETYSLALLLVRVFRAGWEPKSFAKMREELHPKVVEAIYGDAA
jgi:hypothetical protein